MKLSLSKIFTNSNINMDEILKIWKNADAVCFDVDSTVTQEEAIDELAKFCDKGEQVKQLTLKAMSGSMKFEESLKLRLDIIQPSLMQMKEFILNRPPKLSLGIKSLVDVLHNKNIPVYLVSGGFHSIIEPVAQKLNIPVGNIYANRLKFYYTGEYAGFDEEQPTSRSGGKPLVMKLLKEKFGYKKLVIIGDGATDLEASPPADAFIGYGGNVIRESVKTKCNWYITDFNELINSLT